MSGLRESDWLVSAGYENSDDVVRHQFGMLASTVPVLYLGLFLSAFASTAILTTAAPLHLAIFAPAIFLVIAAWRIPLWLKRRREIIDIAKTRRLLRRLAVFVPTTAGVMLLSVSALTAIHGTENLSLAMVACISVYAILVSSTYTLLPACAILVFVAVQPALYFPAIWQGSVLLVGLAVLSSGIMASQAFIIVRQFGLFVRLADSERAARDGMKKMASADQIKAQFLANMGHEIRTPLNGVLGMAELLARSPLGERQQGYLSAIVDSGNRLLRTINNILDYSRIDAGLLVLDETHFRLADVIEDVVHQVSEHTAKKQIEIIQRIDPNLPEYLCGDAARIHQIVGNLVSNAVKFTDAGYVLVDASGSVSHGTANVTIRVEDTGAGIQAERLPEIFRQFAQADEVSTRGRKGTGLGLAIAARLVQLMGGEIGVESEAGDGSTFWLTIPLKIHEVADMPSHVPIDISGARILVVDDNEINRSIMAEQLRFWEFDCVAVESGPVGLALIEHAIKVDAPVDCVILDYLMPDMDGLDIARAMRNQPLMADIPLIMLSSVDDIDLENQDFDPRLITLLKKPARSATLRQAIVDIIQEARNLAPKETAQDDAGRMQAPEADTSEWISRARSSTYRPAEKIDVLVAEDNEVNRTVFDQILVSTGLRYKIVPNGKKAVEAYLQQMPKIVLMDYEMPEMSGLEATRRIRTIESNIGHRATIIGVTAHTHDRQTGLDAGMDGHISKPISPRSLLEAIARETPHNIHIEAG